MKTTKTPSIILLGLCFILSSCEKNEDITVNAPEVKFNIPVMGYTTYVGDIIEIQAETSSTVATNISWFESDKEISKETTLKYSSEIPSIHIIKHIATNEGGATKTIINIEIKSIPAPEVTINTTAHDFKVKRREIITIEAQVESVKDCTVSWKEGEKEISKEKTLEFSSDIIGLHKLTFTAENKGGKTIKELSIKVSSNPNSDMRGAREITADSKMCISKVYDFTPAPGQFTNEGYDCETMEQAIEYAEKSLTKKDAFLSLGGFGGQVIVGFDHSIVNKAMQDFMIKGNSFDGSSEPGIVWVMQDENANGLADDVWLQLKGSEYDKAETIKNYEITYTRPTETDGDVAWTDNQDDSGTIDHNVYHSQAYYPKWIKEETYTLSGTKLKDKTTENNGYYRNDPFDWGYVDNKDHVTDGNLFELDNAVDAEGNTIKLGYIDFIKVQTGVNVKAGWLGEVSTEVFEVKDLN